MGIYVLTFFIIFNSFWFASDVEDGWKGIKSLTTKKFNVDKLFGPSKMDTNGYHMYSTKEAFVEVNFSTTPCVENKYKRGVYVVPENTVLGYRVMFKNAVVLENLRFERNRYVREVDVHVPSHITYSDYDSGITIHVWFEVNGTGIVKELQYSPPKDSAAKLTCSSSPSIKTATW